MTRRTKAAVHLLATISYCEYCRLPAVVIPQGLWIDHIIPRARGGTNAFNNLCVSCPSCNIAKGAQTAAHDPKQNVDVPLFNPRQDIWMEHFRWGDDRVSIEGLTPIGRATVSALKMNKPKMVQFRRLLIQFNITMAGE